MQKVYSLIDAEGKIVYHGLDLNLVDRHSVQFSYR
jgi:hypothetical protein